MSFETIERRRVTLLRRRLDAMMGSAKPSATWRPDVAVDLVRNVLGLESSRRSSLTDIVANSNAAAHYLLMLSEFQLMRWGEYIGYYPMNTSPHIAASIRKNDHTDTRQVNSLADFVDRMNYELLPRSGSEMDLVDNYRYLALEAIWRDALTSELTRCIELVFFTDEGVWQKEIFEVERLSRRLYQNPTLILSGEELDRLTWALTGAEDLYADDSITWTAAWQFFRTGARLQRAQQLFEVRSEISNLCDVLTADGSLAAAQLISRQSNLRAEDVTVPHRWMG